ncbi:MAG TPA: SUMF1/EgtB/PvdO family nonheme iron enzyme, partial [Polyangiaceae bacterium]|nr:SUMF1/EgtB/PvdO family nonheme iron enzyme [Polyangiaceae bacterium]
LEGPRLERTARQDRGAFADALAGRVGAGVLLFIDQAEELLTLSDPADRDAADAAVAALDALPGVRVLASLRTDFLARFAALPNLGEDVARVLYFLRPLSPARVREVIVGPAEATGLRFESEAMVDELAAAANAGGGLPLLQFALAELWKARDAREGVIPRAALDALGGVGGALAKHADSIVLTLPPAQRAEARRILVRLVTLEDTRARRSEAELAPNPAARAALAALVRGRLLVAHEDETGSAYEVAHEVLIREWATLRRWLAEDVAKRSVRERLEAAASEWAQAGRPRDVLWSTRQLQEASALGPDERGLLGGEFVRASELASKRERRARLAALAGVPLVVALAYGGAVAKSRYETNRHVGALLDEADSALGKARVARAGASALRFEAFRRFDARERAGGEEAWAAALARAGAAERGFERVSSALEAAFAQDPGRADVRALLGQALYDRALSAEEAGDQGREAELVRRFSLYDPDGELTRRWNAPGLLSVESSAPGARVALERAEGAARPDPEGAAPAPDAAPAARELGPTPLAPTEVERGAYVIVVSAPGRVDLRYPVLVGRGERLALSLDPPPAADVPAGFVYVAPGRFLFGSADEERVRRGFFDALPRHEVRTGGYLIARTEVTYADWFAYLESLPPAERARRTPHAEAKVGQSGALRLEEREGGWRLALQPMNRVYEARAGEKLVYGGRAQHAAQNWLKFPVTGISAEDAVAYAAWLDTSGRLPGARLCTDYEWERAARGADDREFPQGDKLGPEDANFDKTYGRENMGPDEVGRHPASRSPFGLDDMAGNAFECTRSAIDDKFVVRGGSFFHDDKTAQIVNRTAISATFREASIGARLCVSAKAVERD